MFLENFLGFLGSQLFLAIGAGHVAERRRLRIRRTKLPQRALTLGVGVGRGPTADQRPLTGHVPVLGMKRMVGKQKNLRLVGEHGDSGLSEGSGGA